MVNCSMKVTCGAVPCRAVPPLEFTFPLLLLSDFRFATASSFNYKFKFIVSHESGPENMPQEILNLANVWLSVFLCLCFVYVVGTTTVNPIIRLVFVLPVIAVFLLLPLNLSSVHFSGITGFFVGWLANFKLLLFAFNKGPLSSPALSLPRFIAVACFPIKIQSETAHKPSKSNGLKSSINYATKALLLGLLLKCYDYQERLNRNFLLVLYSSHIYLCLEIVLAMAAALCRAILHVELEEQFNEPYLSTSLQDFWGRRWNLMATSILRPTVYGPVREATASVVGRRWAPLPATFGTFIMSAIMHELIFFYLGRTAPTWEITCFFLFHGVCLTAEIGLKKALEGRRWRLHGVVSAPLTVGFVMVTGFWLFFPPLLRCKADERAFEEYAAVEAFVKNVARSVLSRW